MDIQYAILGLLNWQPLTGYDLKKIISDSEVFYWSGNNNQIYKSLIQLHKDGLVTQTVQPQESLPARKIYAITPQGQEVLRRWLLSNPEPPELRNNFLIQLAWADALSADELDSLLARYEEEIAVQLRMRQARAAGPSAVPNRTARETFLWQQITENMLGVYQYELDWVTRVRKALREQKFSDEA